MDEITALALRGREGQRFDFTDADGRAASLVLTSIEERAEDRGGIMYAVFAAEDPHGLQQGTYEVRHDDFAATALFAVPASEHELCVTFTWLTPESDAPAR